MVQSIIFNNKIYYSNQFIAHEYNDFDDFTGNETIVENRFNDQLCSVVFRNHTDDDMKLIVDSQDVIIRPSVGIKFYKRITNSDLTFLVDSFFL